MSLLLDLPFKIHIFKSGSTCYAKTNDGRVIASSSNDLGSVLDTAVDSLTSGGSIRISGDSYGWGTNVTCTNPRIGIYCETGNVITPTSGHTGDLFTVNAEHFTFADGNIDCSNMANGSGSIFIIGATAASDIPRILRNRIKNPPTNGIQIAGSNCNGLYAMDNSIQNFLSPTGSGILMSNSADHMISGNHVGGFPSGGAISFSGCANSIVRGNEIFSSLRGVSCYLSSGILVENNLIQACNQQGVRIFSDSTADRYNIQVVGNRIHNHSQNPTGTHPGILIGGSSSNVHYGLVVTGNTISDIQGTATQKHGIEFDGTIYRNVIIEGNSIYKNTSIPINAYNIHESCHINNNVTDVRSLPYDIKIPMVGLSTLGHKKGRKFGAFMADNTFNTTGVGLGFMSVGKTLVTSTAAGFSNDFTTGRYMITNTGGTQDTVSGIRQTTLFTMRGWYPRYKARFKLNTSITGIRLWAGLTSNISSAPSGDTELTSKHGIMLAARSTDTNFQIASSNGTATFANALSGGSAKAIDLDVVHTIEICADDANSKWWYSFDDGGWNAVTATIPAQTTGLTGVLMIQNSTNTDQLLHTYYMELETDG